jgi:ATP-dependent helicase/nuclease subunit B
VESRPTTLSVTEIGTWRRNPYAIYARRILGLKKLDPLEPDADASDRGMIIHETLDAFVKKYPDILPENSLEDLLALGRKAFAAYKDHPEVWAFWWPRFERIAAWFVDNERTRRASNIKPLQAEAQGQMQLGAFTLKGRADRIDRMPDDTVSIADYKTGSIPTNKEIAAGYEPQLPLLSLIASKGGFKSIGGTTVSELAYWKLGNDPEIKLLKEIEGLTEQARAGLERLIIKFADPATPWQAVPKPDRQPRYDDYAHLARLQEWGRTEEDS